MSKRMTKHLIPNYEQVKIRLTQLSKEHNASTCDYYFAIGDLFNQELPESSSRGGKIDGMSTVHYQQRLSKEIDALLMVTETDLSVEQLKKKRWTARAWKKSDRVFDVAFEVYSVLAKHQDLMRDGLTVNSARALVSELVDKQATLGITRPGRPRNAYNRTQRLRVGINNLRSMADNDDGTPLTDEQVELLGEAYAVLDAYCERKGIDMYEPELMAA